MAIGSDASVPNAPEETFLIRGKETGKTSPLLQNTQNESQSSYLGKLK